MKVITDVACPGCGCVCDDLRITCDQNRIVQIEPPCPLAEKWYGSINDSLPPPALLTGRAVSLTSAVSRAAEILAAAKSPLVFGLSGNSTAGHRAAIKLAERLGASIDTTASLYHGAGILALQQVGEATSSLGEVRERADLVIFWGVDARRTHPRHFERYSVEPRSELLPGGRSDRTVVVIDSQPNSTAEDADVFIPVPAGNDFEALSLLRLLVRDETDSSFEWPASFASQAQQWRDFANRMRNCRCGVVFFGLSVDQTTLGHHTVAQLSKLVADLNANSHFYSRLMRLQGGATGADHVLCWQTGYPYSVNLGRGYPRYSPGEFSAQDLLARNEVDAAVIVGTEMLNWFSAEARDRLESIPTIVLNGSNVKSSFTPTVLFHTAIPGVHCSGTAYRMDEVPIPLRGFLDTEYPTDEEVLRRVCDLATAGQR